MARSTSLPSWRVESVEPIAPAPPQGGAHFDNGSAPSGNGQPHVVNRNGNGTIGNGTIGNGTIGNGNTEPFQS